MDAKTSVITYNLDEQKQEKEAKENSSQEHENIKENNMSTHATSKEEKQTKKKLRQQ